MTYNIESRLKLWIKAENWDEKPEIKTWLIFDRRLHAPEKPEMYDTMRKLHPRKLHCKTVETQDTTSVRRASHAEPALVSGNDSTWSTSCRQSKQVDTKETKRKKQLYVPPPFLWILEKEIILYQFKRADRSNDTKTLYLIYAEAERVCLVHLSARSQKKWQEDCKSLWA